MFRKHMLLNMLSVWQGARKISHSFIQIFTDSVPRSSLFCIMAHSLKPAREVRQTGISRKYTAKHCASRRTQFDRTYLPRASSLCNSLPPCDFPETPNLQIFKSKVKGLPLSSLYRSAVLPVFRFIPTLIL